MSDTFDGLIWLLLTLGPLLFLQPRLHQEIQGVFLLVTRRVDLSSMFFAILFFPGVLLHESSHFLMAKILRVPTRGFSVFPEKIENGKLIMGYVDIDQTDPLRESLIGAAPLLVGGSFVAYAGVGQLELSQLWLAMAGGNVVAFFDALVTLPSQPDFWLWSYLAFAVSSTMLPSASDRQSWWPLGGILGALLGLSLLAGAGGWLAETLWPRIDTALGAVSVVFGIAVLIHAVLYPLASLIRQVLSTLTGLEVVSG